MRAGLGVKNLQDWTSESVFPSLLYHQVCVGADLAARKLRRVSYLFIRVFLLNLSTRKKIVEVIAENIR